MKFNLKSCMFIVSVFVSLLLIQCGSDPAAEGQKAFDNQNYSQAISLFLQVKKERPQDSSLDEKIALAYMLHGENLYNKRKNLNSFTGNFDKAQEFIPENPSAEFKTAYSKLLYSLAVAYDTTPPQNEIQKEDYFNKTLEYLETAMFIDESNMRADSLFNAIKQANFQKMLDKGKDFLQKAEKQNKADLFVSAEFYLKRATDFDPNNTDTRKLLSRARAKTISVLNIRDDLAMAVADYLHQDGKFILDLALHNYTRTPVEFNLENFHLYDRNGNVCTPDKETNSKFKDVLSNGTIPAEETLNGKFAFKLAKGSQPDYLEYNLDSKRIRKYFP